METVLYRSIWYLIILTKNIFVITTQLMVLSTTAWQQGFDTRRMYLWNFKKCLSYYHLIQQTICIVLAPFTSSFNAVQTQLHKKWGYILIASTLQFIFTLLYQSEVCKQRHTILMVSDASMVSLVNWQIIIWFSYSVYKNMHTCTSITVHISSPNILGIKWKHTSCVGNTSAESDKAQACYGYILVFVISFWSTFQSQHNSLQLQGLSLEAFNKFHSLLHQWSHTRLCLGNWKTQQ